MVQKSNVINNGGIKIDKVGDDIDPSQIKRK